jgi:DNA-binding response OmpR family regulator
VLVGSERDFLSELGWPASRSAPGLSMSPTAPVTEPGYLGAVRLTPIEWRLLEALVRSAGRTVSHDELLIAPQADASADDYASGRAVAGSGVSRRR